MKSYNLLLSFAALLCFAPVSAQQQSPQLGKSSIDEVLQAMTLEEKITLLIGGEMGGKATTIGATGVTQNLVPGAAGTTHAIPRLGIPSIVLADGPAGLRIQPTRDNDPNTYYCTAFPIATLLEHWLSRRSRKIHWSRSKRVWSGCIACPSTQYSEGPTLRA